MSLSLPSSSLPPLPSTVPPNAVAPAKDERTPVRSLDLLIITSRTDFHWEAEQLLDEAGRKGLQAETLFVEDLRGDNEGEQLHDLHRRIGTLTASGKLSDSSATYLSLHGRLSSEFRSAQHLYRRRPDLADFVQFLCQEESASEIAHAGEADNSDDEPASAEASGRVSASEAESEDEAASVSESVSDNESSGDSDQSAEDDPGSAERLPVHLLSACNGSVNFPSEMFCLALRQARLNGTHCTPGYKGLVFVGACYAGRITEGLGTHGSSYLLLNGNKSGNASDATDCMMEAMDMMAEQKRDSGPLPTTRDYLKRLGQVSGENIACVEAGEYEIHKVLEHSEPLLAPAGSRAASQPDRVLAAKLMHGSAEVLQSVFERYGAQRFAHHSTQFLFSMLSMDDMSDPPAIEKKLRVLEKHGVRFPDEVVKSIGVLKQIIENENDSLLLVLLSQRSQGRLPSALLASMGDCIFDLDDSDTPQALQRMCEANTELETAVTAWMVEGLQWSMENKRPTIIMNYQPYFLERVFAARSAREPAILLSAFQRHSRKLIEIERMDFTAEMDKDTFVHDPGQWLSHALVRALLRWQDMQEADALISVAGSLESPVDLQQTIDIAGRTGSQQGKSTVIEFLRARGFAIGS